MKENTQMNAADKERIIAERGRELMQKETRGKAYVCIDLKSFYASVEARERGLDPMSVNLVVADPSRTEKTICLAVTPALKSYGVPGRARLFEVVQQVSRVNRDRLNSAVRSGIIKKNSEGKYAFSASSFASLRYIKTVTKGAWPFVVRSVTT